MLYKLGKLPPRYDHRSLKLTKYLKVGELPSLASSVLNSALVKAPWGMMLNDQLGDCTCAGMGHIAMLVSAAAGKIVVPPDSEILAMYEKIGGYQPGQPSTDNGAVELDALKFMRVTGLSGVKVDAFAEVDPSDQVHVKYSMQLLGSCYIGVQLPQSAMSATDAGLPWTDTSDTNILGGHAVPLVDYDTVGPTCVTWGMLQKMTWDWFAKYCDEAHAPLFLDGFKPSGLDLDLLAQDLVLVAA